ncbi:MAG: metal-sensing transcriptional repressor [Patescibacteria group bacterium]|jgi:DNA-binding FrmR family transcriptional regulator
MESEKTLINLKKAQSHLVKVIKMTEAKEYCVDIMQQNLAVIGLLKSANNMLLEGHLKTCFANAMKGSNEARKKEMIEEILRLEKMSNK